MTSSGNGCFHLLDPKTNQPISDPEVRSFVCEDCGACFKGDHGLNFHKSRSTTCNTPSKTHPDLLTYKPSDTPVDQDEAGPINSLATPKGTRKEITTETAQTMEDVQSKTEPDSTAVERRKSARLTAPKENVQTVDSAAGKRKSKPVAEPSLEGLGLSSESSAEEEPLSVDQKVSMKVCIIHYHVYQDSCPSLCRTHDTRIGAFYSS